MGIRGQSGIRIISRSVGASTVLQPTSPTKWTSSSSPMTSPSST